MSRQFLATVGAIVLGALPATNLAFSQTVAPAAGSGNDGAEPCTHSPICAWGKGRNQVVHEERTADLGFTYAYPFALPDGLTGGR